MTLGPILKNLGVTEEDVNELANVIGPLDSTPIATIVQGILLLKIKKLEQKIEDMHYEHLDQQERDQ